MNFRIALVLVAIAFLGGVGWYASLPPTEAIVATSGGARPAPRASSTPARTTSDSGTRVSPPAAPAAIGRGLIPKAPPATLFTEYLKAKSYRAIYDRLKNSAEGETAEGRLVMWEVLRNCATITEGRRYNYRPPVPKREDFLANLAPGDPQRDRRIAAFEEFTASKCGGFEGIAITQAELDRVLAASASAGDPRARALAMEQDLWQQRRTQGRDAVALTDGNIDAIKDILTTRDPEAIRVAGRILSNPWADTTLRLGPEQQPIEQRAFMNAWLVLACEYGQPCGTDTPRMQQVCALQGHCDAQSFPDYLSYYSSSPHDSQVLSTYRAVIRQAIESGNWSQISVVRGLPNTPGRVNFLPGPR